MRKVYNRQLKGMQRKGHAFKEALRYRSLLNRENLLAAHSSGAPRSRPTSTEETKLPSFPQEFLI